MPIIRRSGGNSRDARMQEAVMNRDGKGGPFGKHDQAHVAISRAALRKIATDGTAAQILDQ